MDNDKIKNTYQKTKIHFGYIIAILVTIIIFLIVNNFGNNTELVGYVSFAVTIASIFLAVISIIYAFYSNNQLSQTLGKLDNSSQSLEKTAHSLDSSSQKVSNISEQLSSEIQKLTETINSIPKSIESMGEKVDKITLLFQETPNPTKNYGKENVSEKIKLMNNLVYGGLLALYIAFLSQKQKKEWKKKIGISDIDDKYWYFYGCISIFGSLGYLSVNKENLNNSFNITSLDDEICNEIEERIESINNPNMKKLINHIEDYFNK